MPLQTQYNLSLEWPVPGKDTDGADGPLFHLQVEKSTLSPTDELLSTLSMLDSIPPSTLSCIFTTAS